MRQRRIKCKVIRTSRDRCYVYRFSDGQRTWQRTSDIPAHPRNRRQAEREAAKIERDLVIGGDVMWCQAVDRYLTEHMSGLSRSYAASFTTAAEALAEVARPAYASDISSADISTFVAVLRRRGRSESTIASYLKTLRAWFRWLKSLQLIDKEPAIQVPRRSKGVRGDMRSRPITAEEFERMLTAVESVRPDDAELWRHILRGIWLGGLRRSEIPILSWDWDAPLCLQIGDPNCLKIRSGDKKTVDYFAPVAPDFVQYVCSRSTRRRGRIFRVDYGPDWIGRIIARIGEGIVVNAKGKTATAHDLRRSFGTRWAKRLAPAELSALMRHADIQTTMRYYVDLEVRDIAAKLEDAIGGDLGGEKPKSQVFKLSKNSKTP